MVILFHHVNHEIVFDITEMLMHLTDIVFVPHCHFVSLTFHCFESQGGRAVIVTRIKYIILWISKEMCGNAYLVYLQWAEYLSLDLKQVFAAHQAFNDSIKHLKW